MTALLIAVAVVWLLASVLAAPVLGRVIRLADEHEHGRWDW